MLKIFDVFRTITFFNVFLRMMLAMICGGIIGIEREVKRRPAGFRTHILICVGAAITTMTSVFVVQKLDLYTDIARLGAQVIAGVGFIGTGAIMVTRGKQVKGLTTAAGLWAVAVVGLCIGAGFYEGGVIATVFILIAELLFGKLESKILHGSEEVNLIVDYANADALRAITTYLEARHFTISNMSAGKNRHGEPYAIFSVRLAYGTDKESLLREIDDIEGTEKVRML